MNLSKGGTTVELRIDEGGKNVEYKEEKVIKVHSEIEEGKTEDIDPREAMKWSLIFSPPRAKEPYRLFMRK